MNYFMDVTIKENAEKYLNKLDKNTLMIYSPTSIEKINFKNEKVKSINWHDISKIIKNIDVVVKENNNIEKVVTFGGGSAIDIGKYIAYKLKVKYICVPSMLSTNSYATNKVALIKDGKKITLDAKLPDCIILDDKILKMSITENLYGLADVLSIYTALYDWKLAAKNINEKIDKKIYDMSLNLLNEVIKFVSDNNIEEISSNTEKLFKYIGRAGYITNLYGTGRPESGSEHIFAKELESKIDIPHGISVSIGIIIMSMIQNKLSNNIVQCIKKIKVLENVGDSGITKELLIMELLNLKPREDRYSIINSLKKDEQYINTLIEKFYQCI